MTEEQEDFNRLIRRVSEPRAMRIDHDLVRLLLLEAEGAQSIDLSGFTKEQIGYHMAHLISGGYAKGVPYQFQDGSFARFTDLTWKSHEFLANARNEIIWKRAKAQIAEHGGSVSLEVLTAVLNQIALKELGLE